MEFDRRYILFFELWNQREYFRCHEAIEDLWIETHGPERRFYQALALSAGVFVHLTRGNLAGARKLVAQALAILEECPPRYMGFALREFVDVLITWQAKVELMSALNEWEFSPEMLPPVEIPTQPSSKPIG